MGKLLTYRKKINVIDRNIVKLLLKRFDLAKQIGNYKSRNKMKIIDKKREMQVINNIKKYSNKENKKFITNVFKNIINYSKKIQK